MCIGSAAVRPSPFFLLPYPLTLALFLLIPLPPIPFLRPTASLADPPTHHPTPSLPTTTNTPPTDCGSSLYTLLDIMPDAACVKAGSIDDLKTRELKVGVEFYTKDRMAYSQAVEGADQKKVFMDS